MNMIFKHITMVSCIVLITTNAFAQSHAIIMNSATNNIMVHDIDVDGDLLVPGESRGTANDPEDWGIYNNNSPYAWVI